MTQEDIIKLAREAGLYVGRNISGVQLVGSSYEEGGLLVHLTVEELERFAALVAEHKLMNIDPSKFMSWHEGYEAGVTAEREACAKVCDVLAVHPEYASDITKVAAQAIRARGDR